MILITAQSSTVWLHGHLILSVSLPPDLKDTGGSKVQGPIYSCCSDRSIKSNYHTHKVALSRVQVISIQPKPRSRLLFHSFLWSRATVWYAEDAPLTVIAEDNYLRLTWRKIRGAPQVQMTGWFANDPVRHSLYEQSFPLSLFHHPPTRSCTFNSTSTDEFMQGQHAICPSPCHTLPLLCPFYFTLSHSSGLVLSLAADLSGLLHV